MPNTNTITLNTPIKMGETQITELTLTEPMAGQIRGVKLFDLMQGDTGAYIEILPRITTPAITKRQASDLSLSDTLKVIEVVGGWLTKGNENTPTA